MGITITIDDLSTGYSNLGYLRNLNAIINMPTILGLKTVAEGIKDKATYKNLPALDCDIGQEGYWSKFIQIETLF